LLVSCPEICPIRPAPRKQFFFEKKNQKTFTFSRTYRCTGRVRQENKSFLFLFFKKEKLPFFAMCKSLRRLV